jgi:hypothetical protein
MLMEQRLLMVDRIRLSIRSKKKLYFSTLIDVPSLVGQQSGRIL